MIHANTIVQITKETAIRQLSMLEHLINTVQLVELRQHSEIYLLFLKQCKNMNLAETNRNYFWNDFEVFDAIEYVVLTLSKLTATSYSPILSLPDQIRVRMGR